MNIETYQSTDWTVIKTERLKALEAALAPFAAIDAQLLNPTIDPHDQWLLKPSGSGNNNGINVAHIYAAKAALKETE